MFVRTGWLTSLQVSFVTAFTCPSANGWVQLPSDDAIPSGEKCFRVIPESLSHTACANRCNNLNASLACISSRIENEFILDNVTRKYRGRPVWLGLFKSKDTESRERGWKEWVSGCDSDYRKWSPDAPEMLFTRSDCASLGGLSTHRHFEWFAHPCNFGFQCLCEYPATTNDSYPPPWIENPPMHFGNTLKLFLAGAMALLIWMAVLFVVPLCIKGHRTIQSQDQQGDNTSSSKSTSTLIQVSAAEPTPVGCLQQQQQQQQESPENTISTVTGFKMRRDENKRRALGGVLTAGARAFALSCVFIAAVVLLF